jgi:acyl-CoA synthetase (AMP-forming)/AMP-acid ligase II
VLVEDMPYLRQVYVVGACTRPWARSLDLSDDGGALDGELSRAEYGSEDLLTAVEDAVTPADLMAVIFTSGATSDPKGVMHTHGAQVRHGWNLAHHFGAGTSQADRVFCALPFFWIGGLSYQLLGALAVGSTVLCVERFTAEAALDLMERERATRFVGWGSQVSAVLEHPSTPQRDLSSAPMFAPRVGDEADTGLRHTSLGMTETSGPHTACPPAEAGRLLPEEMRGSFGRPLPFVHHRIVNPETGAVVGDGEEGELCVRGYNLMAGLYKRERADIFDDDGWYHTGDRCVFRDGYLYYLGRLGDMIKSRGANVAPREVESVLEARAEVQAAIVVGLPDPDHGEIVAAVVVPTYPGAVDVAALAAHAREHLSPYKVPGEITVLDEDAVPWLPTGKPDKQAVVTLLMARRQSP